MKALMPFLLFCATVVSDAGGSVDVERGRKPISVEHRLTSIRKELDAMDLLKALGLVSDKDVWGDLAICVDGGGGLGGSRWEAVDAGKIEPGLQLVFHGRRPKGDRKVRGFIVTYIEAYYDGRKQPVEYRFMQGQWRKQEHKKKDERKKGNE